MKPILLLSTALTLLVCEPAKSQVVNGVDSTGLPGDDFSLQGALALFQEAASPENFEKLLNTEGNHVNNLDLNGDGEIDYLRVIHQREGDAHAFVIQAIVSEKESQDIAVIGLEKTGDTSAIIQVTGDEDIYGEEIIVEPGEREETAALSDFDDHSFVHGPAAGYPRYDAPRIIINVWFWPTVRFVHAPGYVLWRSPWRWRHYPAWWRPWRPLRWHALHPFHRHYHRSFVIVRTPRVMHARGLYVPHRTSSVIVRTRHQATVNNYRVTRTRTTVTGPGGNRATRKTTTVRGPAGGKVKVTKTKRRR